MQNTYVLGEYSGTRMARVTLDDPDVHRKDVPVDDRGRVVIGSEFAGENVTVVAELEDSNDAD